MNNEFKILVMGCDKYSKHTSELFHHCMTKYWPDHPEIIYCNETIQNPYYKTILINLPVQRWTRRLNQALKQVNGSVIMVLPEDTFIRKPVNYEALKRLSVFIDNKLIAINLEPPLDCIPCNEILSIRNPRGRWLTSFMPQLWNREKLIELTNNKDLNPREAEHLGENTPFTHGFVYGIIATNNVDFDFGKIPHVYPYAIVEGKWAREMVGFAQKEGVAINFDELGFFN